MKWEVAIGVTADREFSRSMSVLTGRKQGFSGRGYHHADIACGARPFFVPEIALTDADVAVIAGFQMDEKETHGVVLRRIVPLRCGSRVQ